MKMHVNQTVDANRGAGVSCADYNDLCLEAAAAPEEIL